MIDKKLTWLTRSFPFQNYSSRLASSWLYIYANQKLCAIPRSCLHFKLKLRIEIGTKRPGDPQTWTPKTKTPKSQADAWIRQVGFQGQMSNPVGLGSQSLTWSAGAKPLLAYSTICSHMPSLPLVPVPFPSKSSSSFPVPELALQHHLLLLCRGFLLLGGVPDRKTKGVAPRQIA